MEVEGAFTMDENKHGAIDDGHSSEGAKAGCGLKAEAVEAACGERRRQAEGTARWRVWGRLKTRRAERTRRMWRET